ncbi:hypothetical protein PEC18_33960 [Paucibacter sp. O1-1]|nr:hypothetical protein [Paucibacter sp. O1-1]MDA3830698.1 hypothetical protein [Paucibacter sp. O1-1]
MKSEKQSPTQTERLPITLLEHTDGAGFDVILDTVGGANLTNSIEAEKPTKPTTVANFIVH